MPEKIDFQMSIFGQYNIPPTSQIISDLMEGLSSDIGLKVLPNVITSQRVDLPSAQVSIASFLTLRSEDGAYSISFLEERIDANYTKNAESIYEIEDLAKCCVQSLSFVMSRFSLESYRLAANIQTSMQIQSSAITNVQRDLPSNLSFYSGKVLDEWSTRVNKRQSIAIGEVVEEVNVITEIVEQKLYGTPFSALITHVDYNTVPENGEMRFNSSSLEAFAKKALDTAKLILTDVRTLVGNE